MSPDSKYGHQGSQGVLWGVVLRSSIRAVLEVKNFPIRWWVLDFDFRLNKDRFVPWITLLRDTNILCQRYLFLWRQNISQNPSYNTSLRSGSLCPHKYSLNRKPVVTSETPPPQRLTDPKSIHLDGHYPSESLYTDPYIHQSPVNPTQIYQRKVITVSCHHKRPYYSQRNEIRVLMFMFLFSSLFLLLHVLYPSRTETIHSLH